MRSISAPWLIFVLVTSLLAALPVHSASAAEPKVDFNREVRPILAKKCFACHGPDEEHRESGLRLDQRDAAIGKLESGATAIQPGKASESELVKRIHSAEPEQQMPPHDSGVTLTDEQKKLLTRWIDEGASYAKHWAFVKPVRPPLPADLKLLKQADWPNGPLDQFILEKIEAAGLTPNPVADKYALIRRASLDLRGLPPTPAEVQAFIADQDPKAYEKLLDQFLADPAYGERWSRMWLDQARYADSRGYGSDPLRPNIWRYRDWVINAFNANQPYDQFTLDQIAGDLLPNATVEQKVATAFHRNTMTNTEGGTDDEEFRVVAVKDRVDTTMQVWMGVTIGCAKCHTHKYDPITQKEYYQFYALFNQTADRDLGDEAPLLDAPTPEYQERVKDIETRLAAMRAKLSEPSPQVAADQLTWEKTLQTTSSWQTLPTTEAKAESGAVLATQADGSLLAAAAPARETDVYTLASTTAVEGITAFRLEALADDSLPNKGPGLAQNGNFVLSRFSVKASDAEKSDAQASARFVRVEMPGSGKYLHLAEVQVFSSGVNIALKGTATQSSTDYAGPANLGNDGNTSGDFFGARSTTHTKAEDNPWWEVDLGGEFPLDKITLWNRTDGGTEPRLQGYRMLALDAARKTVWQVSPADVPKPSSDFAPSGIVAVGLSSAAASHSQDNFPVAAAIENGSLTDTGWAIGPKMGTNQEAIFVASSPLAVAKQTRLEFTLQQKYSMPGTLLGKFRLSITTSRDLLNRLRVPADVLAIVDLPTDQRTPEQVTKLAAYYGTIAPTLKALRDEIAALEKTKPPVPNVPVMVELAENQRRKTTIMVKGNFLTKGDEVEAGLPAAFHALPEGAANNRLGLAQWLISPENPLTARVAVNRFWSQLFGCGIVETEEDFGIQGELPTHPELLDYLALEFREKNWDVKALLKTILLSKTYTQASTATPDKIFKDPRNRLLSRGPRFRLEAEMVRDQALSLSGLLSHKMRGPSVFPPQPDGLWQAAFNGERTWTTSPGEDKFRRGLYVFWRRTIPYPSMTTFDAPSREICALRRIRTNTPLQAFVTMNDPVYVETSQMLARRILREGGGTPESRAAFGLQLCLVRPPSEAQVKAVVALYESELKHYQADAVAADKMATQPAGPLPAEMPAAEAAAWTVISNVLLNLDGVLMKG